VTSSASEQRGASRSARAAGTLYVERRWLSGTQTVGFAVIGVIAAVMLLDTARRDPEKIPVTALVLLGFAALALVLSLSPLTDGFSHIRVDGSGLALWWGPLFRLPAAELGDAVVVPEREAGPAARRGRYRDVRIPLGRASYPNLGGAGRAVFVEQRRPGKGTIGWLLATRDPDAVVAALTRLREGGDSSRG
jgi:hypothetical protein